MTLPTPDWIQAARHLLLSRQMDCLEIETLTPQGKVKYQFSAHGHELTQVLLAQALDHPHDAATVYYRSRPFALACGLAPSEALAAGMARAADRGAGLEPLRGLDLDHVGAPIRELANASRPRTHAGKIENGETGERL